MAPLLDRGWHPHDVDEANQRRLTSGVERALAWHGDQRRKGTPAPYASHLLQVAGLVLEHGGSVDQAVAALLHDVVEDTPATVEDVDRHFGPAVAAIVADCTDAFPGDTPARKAPWRQRKERFLDRLGDVSSTSALVIACDKRHNLATMVADVRREGVDAIAPPRFSAAIADQLWYHGAVLDRLRTVVPDGLADELDTLVTELRRAAQVSG